MSTESNSQPLQFYDPNLGERTQIDQEIANLECKLQDLRAKRNALLPIGSLLPEILSQVFSFALIAENGNRRSEDLIPLTWVCRQWRDIAFEYPILWSSIDRTLKENWVLAFLQRSKEADLHISLVRRGVPEEGQTVTSIISRFHRVVRLNLDGSRTLQPICDTPGPALRSVVLKYIVLPEVLFSGKAPRLKSLEIVKCPSFTFRTIPLGSQLTELRVVHSAGKSLITVSDCLTQLGSLPHLQTLILDSLFDDNSPLHSLPEVTLPHLRRLHIINVIVSIWLPFITNVSTNERPVIYFDGWYWEQDLRAYLQVIADTRIVASNSVLMNVSVDGISIEAFDESGASVTWLVMHHRDPREDSDPLLQRMPLHSIQRLSVSDLQLKPTTWALFPNLHSLRLVRKSVTTFIRYIAMTQVAPQSTQFAGQRHDHLTFLPALRNLALEDVLVIYLPPLNIVRSFHRYLMARKESGVGLDTLILRGISSSRLDFLADSAVTFAKENLLI